jgi:glucosamine-6-phosphate deaminase
MEPLNHSALVIRGTAIPSYKFASSQDASCHVAHQIASTIRERNALGHQAVLGLAPGSTPIGVYRELIRLHREENLDFSRVVVFGNNEYWGLDREQSQSLSLSLKENFLRYVNVSSENLHLFDTSVPMEQVEEYCRRYEDELRRVGGFDVILLGIGSNGNIAFNEPYSAMQSQTRLVTLDPITRSAAASDFYSQENTPTQGLTIGMASILSAKKIFVVAYGDHKAGIVHKATEEPMTDLVPASRLREHADAQFLLDDAAAGQLTDVATPWVIGGSLTWDDQLTKRAVLWLSDKTGKALLKLDDDDFRKQGLHQLLRLYGPAQKLCHRVFRWMLETIDYHPVGEEGKPILCFSPHPDDDVISMGGTMIRLVEDGNHLNVAYMTSGNIAVFDHDALRVADLLTEMNRQFEIEIEKTPQLEERVRQSLLSKRAGQGDIEEVMRIKSMIRWSEAKEAATVCGCREEDLFFLDLPFYRTGTIEKKPPTEEDEQIVRKCIEEVDPAVIFVAGDLTDPHGTHRICAMLIFRVLEQMRSEGRTLPEVLLYRGAWQEWPPHLIDITVPLSPRDLELKRAAIFRHESQKDSALFPGPDDPREFWQRAEDRNRATADVYNHFGLPEYFALEAFVRWDGTFPI